MRILQVAELLHPQYGGIAEGVYQQGIELQKLGWASECLSADEERVDRLPASGSPHHVFPPTFKPWKWSRALPLWLKENVGRFDLAVLNGLWMGPLHETARACQKAKVPYVVMPHGMLDPYFRQPLNRRVIKDLYWALSEGRTVKGCRLILFTTEEEERRARAAWPLQKVQSKIVGYGISPPGREAKPLPLGGEVKLCFMSRIHQKKGLDLLLGAMASLPACVTLDIYGSGDEALEALLKEQSKPLGARVRWRGFIKGEDKWKALEDCHAMILPSRQENFGVIVAEAMSVGRPALVTHEVNTWDEVVQSGSGLACEATEEGVKKMVQEFLSLSEEERGKMGQRGVQAFHEKFTIQKSAAAFTQALKEAVQ